MSDYDQGTINVYVENGGGFCPECDCDDVDQYRPVFVGDGMMTMESKCKACNAMWMDSYLLDHVKPMKRGKHADQQQLFAVGSGA